MSVGSLESIILDGAKQILRCSSKTCNEAVRINMGLDTLHSRRNRPKLKWWYKLATMSEDRYPKQLLNQEWNIKPRRGRQRKEWSRMVNNRFKIFRYRRVNGWRILSMEIVHQLHLWLV